MSDMSNATDPRQCWRTPADLWRVIKQLFDPQLDVAANSENHLCDRWIGPTRDGLTFSWQDAMEGQIGTAYCNPGYSYMLQWLPVCYEWAEVGWTVVVLCNVDTSTYWWREWATLASEIHYLTPRVNFDAPADCIQRSSNPKPQALLVYRPYPSMMQQTGQRTTILRWK